MVEAKLKSWITNYDNTTDTLIIYRGDSDHAFCVFRTGLRPSGMTAWYFYPHYFNNSLPLFHIDGVQGENNMTHAEFMTILLARYPEDFEWFLWHPEVFDGEYNG